MNQKTIHWHHADGSVTSIDAYVSEHNLLRVLQEALRSLRGRFPSINSKETIDDILDFLDENDGLVSL